MKGLFVLFFSFIITFLSCDGRDRKYKTNAEVLKEHKLFESFSEEIEYIPELRTEINTDTLLSTGFRIKLQYYSTEDSYSAKTIEPSNHPNKTLHFKNFEAQVKISKNNSVVAQGTINKKLFQTFGPPSFWDAAIMQYVWIDYERSNQDFVTLNTSFNIPKTEVYKDFSIIIKKSGVIELKQINLTETLL